jgi:hypothetical protein
MPRYTLAELLAQCEPGPFELDEAWLNSPAVGAECGSPEWLAAERNGCLDEFVMLQEPGDIEDTFSGAKVQETDPRP